MLLSIRPTQSTRIYQTIPRPLPTPELPPQPIVQFIPSPSLLAQGLFPSASCLPPLGGHRGGLPSALQSESFVDSPELLRFPIKKFRFQGNTLFSDEELQGILQDYLGKDRTLDDLTAVQNDLIETYSNAGYP